MAGRRDEIRRALDMAADAWFRAVRAILESQLEDRPHQWLPPPGLGLNSRPRVGAEGHRGHAGVGTGPFTSPAPELYWTLEVRALLHTGPREPQAYPTELDAGIIPPPPTPRETEMETDEPDGLTTDLGNLRVVVVGDSDEEALPGPSPSRRRSRIVTVHPPTHHPQPPPLVSVSAAAIGIGSPRGPGPNTDSGRPLTSRPPTLGRSGNDL